MVVENWPLTMLPFTLRHPLGAGENLITVILGRYLLTLADSYQVMTDGVSTSSTTARWVIYLLTVVPILRKAIVLELNHHLVGF